MNSRVGIGIVNWNSRELLLRCLEPLDANEIVVVDNGSTDGSAAAVRERYPTVRVVEAGRNLGYAAGANRAITELGGVDYVALLNNDAIAEPGWLEPLVEALDSDPRLGAAAPKILFDRRFVELKLEHEARARSRADPRPAGVRLSGIRVDGEDEWRRAQFVHGWRREEQDEQGPYRWSSGNALLRVPAGEAAELRLDGHWQSFPLDRSPVDVVNNVGSILVAGGYGADRGFLEVDSGQFDKPADVFAWCGAAVLLRRAYLEEVGGFDERLFLYYEDFDLSWRGQARGWRYRYVPASVVRHVHTASSIEGSATFDHYVERNRLVVHAKNAPAAYSARVAFGALRMLLGIVRREIVRRAIVGKRPDAMLARRRLRSYFGFLALLPAILLERLRPGRQRMPYKELTKWLVPL
jgi:GT2 family glycosyltransferase